MPPQKLGNKKKQNFRFFYIKNTVFFHVDENEPIYLVYILISTMQSTQPTYLQTLFA